MNQLLVAKCIVTIEGSRSFNGYRRTDDIGRSPGRGKDNAQRYAIAFPIRLFRLANKGSSETEIRPFLELARLAGQTKATTTTNRYELLLAWWASAATIVVVIVHRE